jgi:Na+-translocating ferredoxin:NAD+ oxidoreductase RnfE subunit
VIKTTWQDFAITGITILFAVMLLPQLRDVLSRGAVLNFFSALFTSLLGYGMALVFATLGLWISMFGQGLVATTWMLLACFSLRNVRNRMYPEKSLAAVALDFFTVWVQGVAFIVAGGVKGLFSRISRE